MHEFLTNYVCLVIFCGGRATRLQSVLGRRSKSVVHLDKKPYLDHLLHFVSRQGIRCCVLCISPFASDVVSVVGDGANYGLIIRYSVDSGFVENAGALWHAKSLISCFPIIVCVNGDTIIDVDIHHLVMAHISVSALATLVASSRDDQPHPGAIEVGLDGWVQTIREDEQDKGLVIARTTGCRYYSNSGIYVFDRARLEKIWPQQFRVGKIEQGLLKHLASQRMLWAYDNAARFLLDFGTPDRLLEARQRLNEISKFLPT